MTPVSERKIEICNCFAVRQAARHITQFYDQYLAHTGLRTTQYSILAKLDRMGPLTIGALAEAMVMDRTTLGRNIKPLVREKLVAVGRERSDRRRKMLRLTAAGTKRVRAAEAAWREAQAKFEAVYGRREAKTLREMLRAVTICNPDRAEESAR
jgi:DNA-binding MarR family transcriptional regulator